MNEWIAVIQGMQDAYNPLYILTEVQGSSVLFVWKASYFKEADEFIWKYQREHKRRRQCRLNIIFVRVLAHMLLLFLFPSIFSIYPFMNSVVMDAFDRSGYAILSFFLSLEERFHERKTVREFWKQSWIFYSFSFHRGYW